MVRGFDRNSRNENRISFGTSSEGDCYDQIMLKRLHYESGAITELRRFQTPRWHYWESHCQVEFVIV